MSGTTPLPLGWLIISRYGPVGAGYFSNFVPEGRPLALQVWPSGSKTAWRGLFSV